MAENRLENPWESLSTVATFDRGARAKSTIRLDNASKRIVGIVTASTSLLIESLVRQLCSLFESDSQARSRLYLAICDRLHELNLIDASYAALELDSVRDQYQLALYKLFSIARTAAGCEGTLTVARPIFGSEPSRYRREFQELSFIASGGFGTVFRALHRLDGIEYAVKKVTLKCNVAQNVAQHLEEVRTLAKLNHANIVAYKCAWMEAATLSELETSVRSSYASESEDSTSNSVSFRDDGQKMLLPYSCDSISGKFEFNGDRYMVLYIQMALCEQTLQQWMEQRVEMTSHKTILDMVTQMLGGLDYIHSRGIVHHDIKPSNIFVSTRNELQMQLGDFGLACPLRKELHGSVLGTHMYAAPEQLKGKCDPKSDVYSLGIVLLELLIRTRTQMERVEIIEGVKRGQIPVHLTAAYPKWVHVVSELVAEDPTKRPSTGQLLRKLNEDKDATIAKLKEALAAKEDLIKQLEARIVCLQRLE